MHLEYKIVHTYFLAFTTTLPLLPCIYLLPCLYRISQQHDPNEFTARKQGAVSDQ